MAVFRVERNKGYTVMSNHHLRNKELTLKAKGLLSQMLSLPEDWDYTLAGLSHINRESIDAIRTAVWELEKAGYITRRQGRDGKGKMTAIEYTIYELPQTSPVLDFPMQSFVERIYIVDENDERYCHFFIKGGTKDDYDEFFRATGCISVTRETGTISRLESNSPLWGLPEPAKRAIL